MINLIRKEKVKLLFNKLPKVPFILALVVILVFVAVKTDWNSIRSYTSKSGNYRIRFPLLFSLHVEKVKVQGKNEYHPVRNIIELDTWGRPKPYVLIGFVDNIEYQPIDDFINNSSECDEITSEPGEKVVVSGLEGRIFRNVNCNSGGETRVYLQNGRTGYNIIFHGKPVDEKMLTLILKNFSLITNNK